MTIDTTPKSPLDGLVSCGACGAPMEYEAPTQDHEASYACRSVHTSGGDSRPPLRVEAHTTDRAVIRSVLEAILTERGNFILESTIRNPGEQEDTGPQFPSEDISPAEGGPVLLPPGSEGYGERQELPRHVHLQHQAVPREGRGSVRFPSPVGQLPGRCKRTGGSPAGEPPCVSRTRGRPQPGH